MKPNHIFRAVLAMAFFLALSAAPTLYAQETGRPAGPPVKSYFVGMPKAHAGQQAQAIAPGRFAPPGKSYFTTLPAAAAQPALTTAAQVPFAPPGKSYFAGLPKASAHAGNALASAARTYVGPPGKSYFVTVPGASAEASSVERASVRDGVQSIAIEACHHGFTPSRIELQAGTPVRLVFTRTADSACMSQVQVPDFGIDKTDLPLNQAVTVEFTPTEAGAFTFACGMDMHKGSLLVKAL
jgi:plastocyanin